MPMTDPKPPIYVPYLSPAGPLPPTPVADEIVARQAKQRIAVAALRDAGETMMAIDLEERMTKSLTPAERELVAIVQWAQETAKRAGFEPPAS